MVKLPIRVSSPYITDEEVELVRKVLLSRRLAAGPVVKEFEERFARFIGVKHALAVANGTIALELILKALSIGPGDEVIVPDFTFIATASTVLMVGAKPVFADIELDTYTIDINDMQNKITNRTKAVVAVHLYGHPANVKALKEICDDKGIYLIEDSAQAHGAKAFGKYVGSFGIASAFSFYATKNLTTGEGGMITTDDDNLANIIKLLRNHGQERRYYHVMLGGNYRMSEIHAAIGLAQLRKLEFMNRRREELAKAYIKRLSNVSWLKLPKVMPWAKHVWHLFVIWVKDGAPMDRDRLSVYLKEKGIETVVHYPRPLHEQPVFKKLGLSKRVKCPNAEEASKHVLSLPLHPSLTIEEVDYVVKALKEVG